MTIATRGLDRCHPNALASDSLDFLAEHEGADNQPDDPFDQLLAFCLATFVDGTPITPLGYDVSEKFNEESVAVTDDETDEDDDPGGTLILSDESFQSLQWHHSVEFDGYEHTTACGREIECDDVRDVLLNPVDGWYKNVRPTDGCPTCFDSVHQKGEFQPVATDDEDDPTVATDGGTNQEPVSIGLFAQWHKKAAENVEKWGLQDTETLLLAMQEELGELTQAHLEARSEGGDPERIPREMDDLGALLLQLHMRLQRDARDGGGVEQ